MIAAPISHAAEKENVAASFDLDKRSVERRIDAMEKNRAMAKRIADGCIKSEIGRASCRERV